MNYFEKTHFDRQAIILLSAQAPSDKNNTTMFTKNMSELMNVFNVLNLRQKIIVLGDESLIDQNILKSSNWLFAYNSAYEQPLMTSLQRGISMLHKEIDSALVWPINSCSKSTKEIYKMLQYQQNHLDKIIKISNHTFPMCIPNSQFPYLLSLKANVKIDQKLDPETRFTNL